MIPENSTDVSYFRETLYQCNLKALQEKANGKELLNLRETATLLGFKDTRAVKKMFPFINGYISVPTLALYVTPDVESIAALIKDINNQ